MRKGVWLIAFVLFAVTQSATAGLNSVQVIVQLDGKPLPNVRMTFWDSEQSVRVHSATNGSGVAMFVLGEKTARELREKPLLSVTFSIDEDDPNVDDLVFDTPVSSGAAIIVVARRSARWRMRTAPRVCDELRRVGDIPVGGLHLVSADSYDEWYASLPAEVLKHCETMTRLQARLGSLAPWYFYAYKAQEHSCVNGSAWEIDWATWYRGLLAEATGADPGSCEADWACWWESQGYEPVPDPLNAKKVGAIE